MESTDDMMKVVIWLFLKILSGVQLLTCNVIFQSMYVISLDLNLWTKFGKRQYAIHRQDQESCDEVDEFIDKLYLLKGIPSVSFNFPSRFYQLKVNNRNTILLF